MKYKIIVFLFMIIFLALGFGITYSFFQSKSTGVVNQKIAHFIFNAESLDYLELSPLNLNPGENIDYHFSITNSTNANISNVSVEYQLIVKTYHLVPLLIELYKVNDTEEELIMTCDESYTRNASNELICNAPIQEMRYATEATDQYKLKVSFPSEYSDESYSGLVDFINVEIKSWQKI